MLSVPGLVGTGAVHALGLLVVSSIALSPQSECLCVVPNQNFVDIDLPALVTFALDDPQPSIKIIVSTPAVRSRLRQQQCQSTGSAKLLSAPTFAARSLPMTEDALGWWACLSIDATGRVSSVTEMGRWRSPNLVKATRELEFAPAANGHSARLYLRYG